jgi:TPP-dependent pyruvate/acetoin dehydrogenase alpha subunit
MDSPPEGLLPLSYTEAELAQKLGDGWKGTLELAYRWMLFGRLMDTRFLGLQRQGRVGFYGPATGHEAVNVGSALALQKEDWILPGLREQLLALARGLDLQGYVHHLFGNGTDPSLGRQMPCHPTGKPVHYVSMASTVGTQISQAVGSAYAQRYRGETGITAVFFGDGATSTTDFHSGMNFASVYNVPVLFVCANNQWAISVPVAKQTAVPVLANKAKAYGMRGVRMDGTDVVEVISQVREARASLLAGNGPVFLEALVFRMNPHSSSDDPTRYYPANWMKEARAHDPLGRLEGLVDRLQLLAPEKKEALRKEIEDMFRKAIAEAEVAPPPSPDTLFRDTLSETHWPLTEERDTFDRDQGGHFP